jgi:hypothetical protein
LVERQQPGNQMRFSFKALVDRTEIEVIQQRLRGEIEAGEEQDDDR